MKKIVIYLLIITLIMNVNISVHAQSNNNEFYETTVDNTLVLTSSDPNLPSSGSYYFGLTSDSHVWYVAMNKAIPMIMNKVIGVTLKPEVLVDFISDYLEFGLVNSPYKPVYNGSTKIGIAFDDLTGKTLLGSNQTSDTNVTIPGTESNNVYNYYNQWFTDEGYNDPDWISVETRNKDFFLNKLDTSSTKYQALTNYLNSTDYNVTVMQYNNTNMTYGLPSSDSWLCDVPIDKQLFVCQGNGFGQTFLDAYHLSTNKNTLNFTDMMLGGAQQMIYLKNTDSMNTNVIAKYPMLKTDGTYTIDTNGYRYYIGSYKYLPCSDMPYITIFKNSTVLNQIVNQTYAPVSFNSEEYYNYDVSNDNSTTSTTSEIDNSTTTNNEIYNSTSESFSEYYSENNYHIDNSVTIQSTTEIINNYYGNGDDNGGDDNGGGSGGDSEDDSGLLDKLIDAILGLFKSIGKILVAVLTGIVDLLSSILETIAEITTSFDGITNLFSAVFGWLPDPIINLMVLGLGLALLAAFITWFR